MSNGATGWQTTPPDIAYPLAQRVGHAESHILAASACGFLDQTSCWRICQTYGVPHLIDQLKELRARLRNELSFAGDK